MDLNKRPIIGIAGKKNSGKDTVGSMINYILSTGFANATYKEWVIKCDKPHYFNFTDGNVIHFGDKVKDICSDLFNIPRNLFDDRKYKDELYYLFDKGEFVEEKGIVGYYKYTDTCSNLSYYIEQTDSKVCFKLRTLLQFVGTNIGRESLFKNVWVNYTINKAIDISNQKGYCIIPDVRFPNEAKKLSINGKGYIIKLERDIDSNDNHESETSIDNIKHVDFVIKNDSTKTVLFYKVFNILNVIYDIDKEWKKKQLKEQSTHPLQGNYKK